MHRTSSRTSLSSRTLLNLRISRPLSRSLCAIPSRVKRETEQLQDVLLKINAKHLGPLERRPFTEGIPKPVVLLLGNHSSGKSSFINYVLGRDVQTTGVAPTDDGFTVIQPGTEDADRDGASFIGDPGLGFGPLRAFGPSFMNHFALKVRKGLNTDGLILVDSPGMIDSPKSNALPYDATMAERSTAERGYDFLRVTRWLAEHSDVILLFFDPDKPGTTGETLECLTSSLSGLEHKLHIVMNKVDQFVHIHDFARAYGSLCWNLSKVIPRKDLPRIYTMFLPPEARSDKPRFESTDPMAASSLSYALAELNATRDEVLSAVHSAPEKRVDNLITRAHDAAALLRMHAVVLEEARSAYSSLRMRWLGVVGGLTAAAPLSAYTAMTTFDVTAQISSGIGGGVLAIALLAAVRSRVSLAEAHAALLSDAGLDGIFERLHAVEVRERDEFVYSLWRRVRPQLQESLTESKQLHELAAVSPQDLKTLDEILSQTVPELRRLTSSVGGGDEGVAVPGSMRAVQEKWASEHAPTVEK